MAPDLPVMALDQLIQIGLDNQPASLGGGGPRVPTRVGIARSGISADYTG
jgi:hypothetical protein